MKEKTRAHTPPGIYTQRQGKVTSKCNTLSIGLHLVHSERRTADTSTLNLMA